MEIPNSKHQITTIKELNSNTFQVNLYQIVGQRGIYVDKASRLLDTITNNDGEILNIHIDIENPKGHIPHVKSGSKDDDHPHTKGDSELTGV